MNRFEALVSLNKVLDIGYHRLNKLLEYFQTPQNILKVGKEKLACFPGIGEKTAQKIQDLTQEDLEREFVLANKLGLKIISFEDDDYPQILKRISSPPIVLYVKGKILKEDQMSIAIVGSRRGSLYGLTSAQKFAFELAGKGLTIVSGMARGVDTYAHLGALKRGARTIAVMGSGFAKIYPAQNLELAQEISRNGAVISEFPIETLPLPQNFPRRNRIISGLSLGVLVVEAARNSGALITADFALEQNREVFALPGKVDSQTSFGTNQLIKQGAKLVSTVEDILEELAVPVACGCTIKQTQHKEITLTDKEEAHLYNLIPDESIQLEELIEKTGLDFSRVTTLLLRLELKGLIKQLPGNYLIRSEHETKLPSYC